MGFKENYRLIKEQFFYLFIYLAFLSFFCVNRSNDHITWLKIGSVIFFLQLLPSAYLHISYYNQAKNTEIKFFDDFVEVIRNGSKIVITNKSIISLDFYMSPTFIDYNHPQGGMTWEVYNFLVIKVFDDTIIINSLIYSNLKAITYIFPDIKAEFHPTVFASLP